MKAISFILCSLLLTFSEVKAAAFGISTGDSTKVRNEETKPSNSSESTTKEDQSKSEKTILAKSVDAPNSENTDITKPLKVRIVLLLGSTYGPSSQEDLKLSSGFTSSQYSRDQEGRIVGIAFDKDLVPSISIGVIFESSVYGYSTGGAPDKESTLLLFPRYQYQASNGTLWWAGVGAGLTNTAVGELTTTNSTVSLMALNSSVNSFSWSPRVGWDDVFGNFTLGLEVAYFATSFPINFIVNNKTSGAQIGSGTIDTSRSWMSISARLGFQF